MLPPHRFYYLHNFQRALQVVASRCADLLDPAEHDFLRQFAMLSQPAQALFVRMAMRRGPWFRASRLVYEEIPDVPAAATALAQRGWLDAAAPMTLDELFGLCTLPELRAIFAGQAPASARKSDLLETLRARHDQPRTCAQWCGPSWEPAWRFMLGECCDRLRLMFFGNLHQDWSEFVLADLGIFQYEAVPFDAAARAFQNRDDVDRYLALHACRQALEDGAPPAGLLPHIQACASANPWIEQRRAKTLMRVGQACERAQDWQAALQVYQYCQYPGARHRRIRVLERMGKHRESLGLAMQALDAPENEEEHQRVARMLPRLRRNAGHPAAPRAGRLVPRRLDLTLPRPARPQPVEHVARDHLHCDTAPVYYVENTLITSLFGLLCWQAVFAPVPGAFFHPFQRGPADLHAPDFAQRRAGLFATSLAQLDTGGYRDVILHNYAGKAGVQSPFVFWGALSEPLLHTALGCLPPQHLKLFFTRILQNVGSNCTGLPDLVRFWPAQKRYELIEVKGPGDKLQDNQVRWLQYCALHDIPAQVCHVRWLEESA